MKNVEVVAAIIVNNNHILATKRGYGEFINMWEFPGGKVMEGEDREDALLREIKEELDVTINIMGHFKTVEYDYDTFHLTMHCYLCTIKEGSVTLIEHKDGVWLTPSNLKTLTWLPADLTIIDDLIKHFDA